MQPFLGHEGSSEHEFLLKVQRKHSEEASDAVASIGGMAFMHIL